MSGTLADVHRLLEAGIDHFHWQSFDGDRLVLVGSFDLTYYHEVELTFTGVESVRCPVWFTAEQFREERVAGGLRRWEIQTGEQPVQIVAQGLEVEVAKVYYYDRPNLQPGERIAAGVIRAAPKGNGGESVDVNRNRVMPDNWSNPATADRYYNDFPGEPTLYSQYAQGDQCGGCSFYAKFNSDWGLCCHEGSRHHTETVFEHFTCPAYCGEQWGPHSFTESREYHCRCGGTPPTG